MRVAKGHLQHGSRITGMALSNLNDFMQFWSPASHLIQLCRSIWDRPQAYWQISAYDRVLLAGPQNTTYRKSASQFTKFQ
jgi:hypothetical protein